MSDILHASDELSRLIAQADRRLHVQLDALLREEGLPVEQWRVLDALADGQGRAMTELSDQVLINLSALSKMIDRMVSRALIFRAPDQSDGRKVLVFISDRGLEIHRRIKPAVRERDASLQRTFGKKNVVELKRLLAALIERTE